MVAWGTLNFITSCGVRQLPLTQRLKCYDRHPDPGASGRIIRDYLIFAKSNYTVNKTVVNIAP